MNCKKAKEIKLTDILEKIDAREKKKTNRKIWYLSPFREEKKASFKVNLDKNTWYDFGEGKGGNILDFVMLYFKTDLRGALKELSENSFSFPQQPLRKASERKKENWRIREIKSVQHPALINYIKKRGVFDQRQLLKEIHYTVNDKSYFGVGFQNNSGGWEIRNKYAKICLGKKNITLIKSNNNVLRIFEGSFDFLSFLKIRKSLEMKTSDCLILNSVSLIEQAKNTLKSYLKIELYLDNDQTGDKATETLKNACKNIEDNRLLYRNFKDLNDYLMGAKGQKNKV